MCESEESKRQKLEGNIHLHPAWFSSKNPAHVRRKPSAFSCVIPTAILARIGSLIQERAHPNKSKKNKKAEKRRKHDTNPWTTPYTSTSPYAVTPSPTFSYFDIMSAWPNPWGDMTVPRRRIDSRELAPCDHTPYPPTTRRTTAESVFDIPRSPPNYDNAVLERTRTREVESIAGGDGNRRRATRSAPPRPLRTTEEQYGGLRGNALYAALNGGEDLYNHAEHVEYRAGPDALTPQQRREGHVEVVSVGSSSVSPFRSNSGSDDVAAEDWAEDDGGRRSGGRKGSTVSMKSWKNACRRLSQVVLGQRKDSVADTTVEKDRKQGDERNLLKKRRRSKDCGVPDHADRSGIVS
ncbi:hypothetical protein K490DRAFT_65004 [Saccharata proteae CBS 121410]|uniref:Pal1-domain-containing protein n=1 Tax=Saccharata proteae CBS 121410 TaxID=1314787 RepID=A0A9P4HWX2_9PEZI|nr:hypothetical protein K490DRAFT_65004 [Saccharata proteae CBS 121410]